MSSVGIDMQLIYTYIIMQKKYSLDIAGKRKRKGVSSRPTMQTTHTPSENAMPTTETPKSAQSTQCSNANLCNGKVLYEEV
jgi:hypothetical protein